MTISDAGNMQEMRVWVMKPQVMPEDTPPRGYPSYSFKWSWGDMVEHKRLIVTRHASLPGAMGSADFKLLRNTIDDNSPLSKHPYTWNETANPLVPGMYVFVTAGGLGVVSPGGKLDYSKVIWFGFIDQIDGDQLAGSTELIGTVSALEVGNILDRMQVRGWAKAGANGSGSSNAITISAPDSANIGGKVDGQIIDQSRGFDPGRIRIFTDDRLVVLEGKPGHRVPLEESPGYRARIGDRVAGMDQPVQLRPNSRRGVRDCGAADHGCRRSVRWGADEPV